MATLSKPPQPYPGFPLYAHGSGQWAKKIRGTTYYFGRTEDGWEAAEAKYNAHREDLHAGRGWRDLSGRVTVRDICDRYLEAGEDRVANGEINRTSWEDSLRTAKIFAGHLGKSREVTTLRVIDFESFRSYLLATYPSVATVAGHIARTKAILKWAYDVELVPTPIRTGPNFRRPSSSQFRRQRAAKPRQFFEPHEIHALLRIASPQMRAILLLGINAALGNRDCGELEHRHLDLSGGWLTYPRHKTGIDRRAKLWPETLEALAIVAARRTAPRDRSLRSRVLLTKYGGPWAKPESRDSPIANEFAKLLRKTGTPTGRGFYALRHTFRTVADAAGDQVAARYVMGHVDTSIDAKYRESIDDARLESVAAHVRAWFLRPLAAPEETAEESPQG